MRTTAFAPLSMACLMVGSAATMRCVPWGCSVSVLVGGQRHTCVPSPPSTEIATATDGIVCDLAVAVEWDVEVDAVHNCRMSVSYNVVVAILPPPSPDEDALPLEVDVADAELGREGLRKGRIPVRGMSEHGREQAIHC